MLVAAVVGLGVIVLYTATGGLSRAVATLGTSLGGIFDKLTATSSPGPSGSLFAESPIIDPPSEPYTNQKGIDLVITVPGEVVGKGALVRLYVALADQVSSPAHEDVPVGSTPRVVVPDVELTKGANDFTATLVGPDGAESEQSPVVRYIYDGVKPRITLTSPKDGATVNRETVKLTGKTQGRSALVARNSANATSVTGAAAANGTFALTLPLVTGSNAITITATDPAGNTGELVLSVQRGSGELTAVLTASIYRIRISRLPEPIELEVLVTDPDGKPLEGARVTFSLTIPGIAPLTFETQTGGDGRAIFRTTVPKGATAGTGPASVLVRTSEFGRITDRTVIAMLD
jgi:Glucodextranase, domain B